MNASLERPGTFCRPGPIGRTIRFILAIVLLFSAVNLAAMGLPRIRAIAGDPLFWFGLVVSLLLLRAIFTGGFGLAWGWWPLAAVLGLAVTAAGFSVVGIDQ